MWRRDCELRPSHLPLSVKLLPIAQYEDWVVRDICIPLAMHKTASTLLHYPNGTTGGLSCIVQLAQCPAVYSKA